MRFVITGSDIVWTLAALALCYGVWSEKITMGCKAIPNGMGCAIAWPEKK